MDDFAAGAPGRMEVLHMARTGRTPHGRASGARSRAPVFAALDLGTNNCRLLMAVQTVDGGMRVVDGFSRIVRLGEGLAATGRLDERAMARAYMALSACAERIDARKPVAIGCVATQACRAASNGQVFLDRVRQDLGLKFEIITPEEEARLSVLGCTSLLDANAEAALIVDIGGGSTEMSWVSPRDVLSGGLQAPLIAWGTTPIGVVTLSEEDSEPDHDREPWYESVVARLARRFAEVGGAEAVRPAFEAGRAHLIGTSGTVTSLAGVHLGLPKYNRAAVDGLWFNVADCRTVIAKLLSQSRAERAANPCIGKDRADLVVMGGAILDAVLRVWPVERIRVADRGLREGVLMRLMAEHKAAR